MDTIQKNCSKHLFLSYSWKDLELADRIDYELTSQGVDVKRDIRDIGVWRVSCLLYTSPSPRDGLLSRMPSSA